MTSESPSFSVRRATDEDLPPAFRLRVRWVRETDPSVTFDDEGYVSESLDWARANRNSYFPHVAVDSQNVVVGMAWLALSARVPTPLHPNRLYGDLQSCYVLPEYRGHGIGALLVRAVLDTAREHGVEHVSVHSTPDARSLYLRNGFWENPRLMYAGDDEKPA